jgi:hypothetical protein
MKVRLTVERDGTPLFSTIFEMTNGDISVAAPAPLNEFRRQYPDISLLDEGVRIKLTRQSEEAAQSSLKVGRPYNYS